MSLTTKNIHFYFLYKPFLFPNRRNLKKFIEQLIADEGYNIHYLNYIFCSDQYLNIYNKQYLNHNTLTDIITFPFNEPYEPITGDIYISIDRIKENAHFFKTTFSKELHRVIFHGVLHLCGYKDKTKNQKELIRNKEDYYLYKYFVSREKT
jgi:rRNA maturation RNase YbeY